MKTKQRAAGTKQRAADTKQKQGQQVPNKGQQVPNKRQQVAVAVIVVFSCAVHAEAVKVKSAEQAL